MTKRQPKTVGVTHWPHCAYIDCGTECDCGTPDASGLTGPRPGVAVSDDDLDTLADGDPDGRGAAYRAVAEIRALRAEVAELRAKVCAPAPVEPDEPSFRDELRDLLGALDENEYGHGTRAKVREAMERARDALGLTP